MRRSFSVRADYMDSGDDVSEALPTARLLCDHVLSVQGVHFESCSMSAVTPKNDCDVYHLNAGCAFRKLQDERSVRGRIHSYRHVPSILSGE